MSDVTIHNFLVSMLIVGLSACGDGTPEEETSTGNGSESDAPDGGRDTEPQEDSETSAEEDTGTGEAPLVHHLEIDIEGSPAAADGVEAVNVVVTAFDSGGSPTPEAELLDLYLLAGFEPRPVRYDTNGDGTFTATLTSKVAGSRDLRVEDVEGHVASETVSFLAGPPAAMEIVSLPTATVSAGGDRDFVTTATIVLRDDNNNPVEVAPEDLSATADAGIVGDVVQDPDHPYYRVDVTSPVYAFGALFVTYSEGLASPLQAEAPLFFPPATIRTGTPEGGRPGIETGGVIDIFFEVNVPGGIDSIDYFDARILFDNTILDYDDPVELGEDCTMDYAMSYGYAVEFGGTCPDFTGTTIPFSFGLEPLFSDVEEPMILDDILYTDEDGNSLSPTDFSTEWSPHLIYTLTTKQKKTLPVQVWVQPGHATTEGVKKDIDQANDLLALNAKRGACALFYVLEPTVTVLSDAEWAELAGANHAMDVLERRDAHLANGGGTYDDGAYNVYYGDIDAEGVGGTYDPTSPAAFVDNGDDVGNLVFAHELLHLMADDLLDATEDTLDEGAGYPGNLFNLDDVGMNLTSEQCALLPK
jgi:hypothetical protein